MPTYTVVERHEVKGIGGRPSGEWRATVEARDCYGPAALYFVSLIRGRRVRLAYSAKWGNKWYAQVRRKADGRKIVEGECSKSTGLVRMLEWAGLSPLRAKLRAALEGEASYRRLSIQELEGKIAQVERGNLPLGVYTWDKGRFLAEYQSQLASAREGLKGTEGALSRDNALRALHKED